MQTTLPRHRQRTQDLCGVLTEKARVLGPDAKMPTTVELCHEFKTSPTTLNNALKELERRNVIYRVRAVGIFVSPTLRPNVALVVDPKVFRGVLHSPFWDLLARRAEERAVALGENFSFHFALPQGQYNGSPPIHVGLVHAIENRQVGGIIAVNLNKEAIHWLEAQDIPLVGFAAPCRHNVEHDLDAMMHMGVQALQQRGCQRVAMWAPADERVAMRTPADPLYKSEEYFAAPLQWAVKEECNLFSTALKGAGLEFASDLVRDNRVLLRGQKVTAIPSEREQGYETARSVFAADGQSVTARPDGILITHDLMAAGAMKALEKLDIVVGRDIQIATLANAGSPILSDYEDQLIRLEFDAQEVASQLFAMLEALMRGETVVEPSVKVAPHLQVPEN
jgi:DNA-binding LacI/PurR family transcriptional regulator